MASPVTVVTVVNVVNVVNVEFVLLRVWTVVTLEFMGVSKRVSGGRVK